MPFMLRFSPINVILFAAPQPQIKFVIRLVFLGIISLTTVFWLIAIYSILLHSKLLYTYVCLLLRFTRRRTQIQSPKRNIYLILT
jgi:hypothetical protein